VEICKWVGGWCGGRGGRGEAFLGEIDRAVVGGLVGGEKGGELGEELGLC